MVKRIAPLFTGEHILFSARLEIRMNAYASLFKSIPSPLVGEGSRERASIFADQIAQRAARQLVYVEKRFDMNHLINPDPETYPVVSLAINSNFTTTSMVKKIAPLCIGEPMSFACTQHRLKGEEASYEPYI